jgi:hypothetical protein
MPYPKLFVFMFEHNLISFHENDIADELDIEGDIVQIRLISSKKMENTPQTKKSHFYVYAYKFKTQLIQLGHPRK